MTYDQNTHSEHDEQEQKLIDEAIRRGQESAEGDFKSKFEAVNAEKEKLIARIHELEDEAKEAKKDTDEELKERMIRLQADWENFRRRTARERIEERERACEKLIVNILPVLDDMERALEHAQGDIDNDEQLRNFYEGMCAIYAKTLDVLAKEGVEKMEPLGDPFDPNKHRAVGRVEDKDMFDESVHDVYQNGYVIGNRVIREAMVAVSYGGPLRPDETAAEAEKTNAVIEEEILKDDE